MRKENVAHLKKSTIISTFSLFFQSGYAAVLGLAANLVLTILLSPAVFGIYITVLSLISLLNYFSDIGLAASLIQKKDITDDDIKTTFTLQQILIITTISIGFLLGHFVQSFYKLPPEGIYLYYALLLSFFISSLKTIPSIFLERHIQFQKIVIVQIIENTVFYISVIMLALAHFSLMSFTYSVILRAVVGLIAIYTISPWIPRIGIAPHSVKTLLSFGVPFQASSFLALFKDDLIILFLGKILGFEGVGYIGWAKKWAEAPIRIIMDNLSRVIFPLIARFQDDENRVKQLLQKILYYQTALLAPLMLGLAYGMNQLIYLIPHYEKWAKALPIFYIFILSSFLVTYSSPFMNLFNALGKVKTTFSLMVFWTVIMWIFTPITTRLWGMYGFPLTHLLISLTFVLVIYIGRRYVSLSFFAGLLPFIVSALGMGLFLLIFTFFIPLQSFVFLSISVCLAAVVYYLFVHFVFRIHIIFDFIQLLRKNI
ncbi:oligosaccharide flippase family protein [Candidatus Roizmanbacteria bacterium]|nr:oligosaccharide flippase family protein [Candidatus Roizmanbacteria bacterium]